MSNESEDSEGILFKKMSSSGIKGQNLSSREKDSESMDSLCVGTESVDFPSIDNNCFIDNASIDTASIDNCFQDSLSVGNSSINVSMDLQDASENTLDLQEITQSILDLEGTQISRNSSEYGTSTELQGITQVPSSPPPSYEHVLAETRLAQQAAQGEATRKGASAGDGSNTSTEPVDNVPPEPKKAVEIMHKSHKEFYKAVAKQWGITCKMSDHCRCLDCQSMYFDCEYDYNEQEKTDGGLGAGTPMFISEVMHGSACTLLAWTKIWEHRKKHIDETKTVEELFPHPLPLRAVSEENTQTVGKYIPTLDCDKPTKLFYEVSHIFLQLLQVIWALG